jgi:Acyl-CoA synthetases (AMP-forming)/AMP-acid ligases II
MNITMHGSQQLLIKNILQSPIQDHPDQEIVYADTLRFTYAQFRERVARLASMLLAQGVEAGDTVAVMDYDSHRYLECYFAIPMIGAVMHTINIRLSPEQMVYTIGHAEDDVILVNSDFLPLLEQIKGRLDTVEKFILLSDTGDAPATTLPLAGEYEALLAASQPLTEFPDFDENTRATTFYTTGTTGLPKASSSATASSSCTPWPASPRLGPTPPKGAFTAKTCTCPSPHVPCPRLGHPVHGHHARREAGLSGQVHPRGPGAAHRHRKGHLQPLRADHPAHAPVRPQMRPIRSCRLEGDHRRRGHAQAICAAALDRGIDVYTGYGMSETCPILSLAHLSDAELQLDRETQIALRTRTGKALPMVRLRLDDDNGTEAAQ